MELFWFARIGGKFSGPDRAAVSAVYVLDYALLCLLSMHCVASSGRARLADAIFGGFPFRGFCHDHLQCGVSLHKCPGNPPPRRTRSAALTWAAVSPLLWPKALGTVGVTVGTQSIITPHLSPFPTAPEVHEDGIGCLYYWG